MALRDLLAGEQQDAEEAAASAAHGRSITGFSGRHRELGDEPIAGERVAPVAPGRSAAARATAPQRVPFGAMTLTLHVEARPGFFQHWFNDVPGRIERAKLAGYTNRADPEGRPICRTVGKDEAAKPITAYLMEIPREWYDQDIGLQQSELEERLADIRHGRSGPGGNDPTRYVGKQGITVRRSGRPL